jgi:hypothetical protein
MELEGSLSFSQGPATGPYSELDEPISYLSILFPFDPF